MDRDDIAVVIPIYKNDLNVFEEVSLKQAFRILNGYHIYFAMPDSLEYRIGDIYEDRYIIARFDDSYFHDTASYSRLCLERLFYEIFTEYEYILIYQLDAFVFYDGLLEFCNMGYDYIGAVTRHHWSGNYVVGNGGLSLRNIKRVLKLLDNKEQIMDASGYRSIFEIREDNFFSYCGVNPDIDFKVPDYSIASIFSVQRDCCHAIRDINKRGLPFGIHYFPMLNYAFWKPVIESYGYMLPSVDEVKTEDELGENQARRFQAYSVRMLADVSEEYKNKFVDGLGLDMSKDYIIWGSGKYGKIITRILKGLGLNLRYIFDKYAEIKTLCGIPVIHPDLALLNGNTILIIGTQRYEIEILCELMERYHLNAADCILFSDIWTRWEVCRKLYINAFLAIEGITIPIEVDAKYIGQN